MDPTQLLPGILAPAAVVGVFLLIAWGLASQASRRNQDAPGGAAAFALGAGALAGFVLLHGFQPKPTESWLWMVWVYPAVAILGALEARPALPLFARSLVRVLLIGGALWLVLGKRLWPASGEIDFAKSGLYLGSALAVSLLWSAVLPQLGAALGASAMWLASTAVSALLVFAGSVRLAGLAAGIAGGLGALIVACLLRPSARGMAGAILPAVVMLSMLAFLSLEFSHAAYPPWIFALVASAPLLGLCAPAARPFVRLALVAVPVLVAVGWGFSTYEQSPY